MRKFLLLLCAVVFSLPAFSQVSFKTASDRIDVVIDGKPFTTLNYGAEANKPYFYPVLDASGAAVTRGFPMETISGESTDHAHQRSLWFGAERVTGGDFWENEPSYRGEHPGKIVIRKVVSARGGKKAGKLVLLVDWIGAAGEKLIDQTLTLTFSAGAPALRVMDIDFQLKALKAVTFEDHKDAILGLRLAAPFEEAHGGMPTNAEGLQGGDKIRGSRSPWVDWQGTVNGERIGVAVMDSPKNIHHPTEWHAQPYGMLFADPFAQHQFHPELPDTSVTIQPGQTLHLKYRIVIHPAEFSVADAYKEFEAR